MPVFVDQTVGGVFPVPRHGFDQFGPPLFHLFYLSTVFYEFVDSNDKERAAVLTPETTAIFATEPKISRVKTEERSYLTQSRQTQESEVKAEFGADPSGYLTMSIDVIDKETDLFFSHRKIAYPQYSQNGPKTIAGPVLVEVSQTGINTVLGITGLK